MQARREHPLSKPLIGVAELVGRRDKPDLVVVDCRHQLSDSEAGRKAFLSGHIPGAVHVNLDRDLSRVPGRTDGRHPLPDPSAFAATLGRLGISNASSVVAYDDTGGAIAARLWWMLRWIGHDEVSVLDGGLSAWQAAGQALEAGERTPAPAARAFVPGGAHEDWVVSTPELERLLAAGGIVLIDARAAERFDGISEPIDAVAGHVPGAVNLPYNLLLDGSGRFLAPDDIARRIGQVAPGRGPREVVAMCGSGVTACHLLLGMDAARMGMARLYPGSWSEWIKDGGRAVATREPS